jgi:hypothetical protein
MGTLPNDTNGGCLVPNCTAAKLTVVCACKQPLAMIEVSSYFSAVRGIGSRLLNDKMASNQHDNRVIRWTQRRFHTDGAKCPLKSPIPALELEFLPS